MAERQGLLQGRHLSPVQTKALVILKILDDREKAEGRSRDLKLAYLASGLASKPWLLFPGEIPEPEDQQEPPSATTVDEAIDRDDYSNVEWKAPSEAIEEYEDLIREIAQARTGTLHGDDVAGQPLPTPTDGGWI